MRNMFLNSGFIANRSQAGKSRVYKGIERRRYGRRITGDRRSVIRYELDTAVRRVPRNRRVAHVWDGRSIFTMP